MNPFLTNESLEKIIELLKLKEEDKERIREKMKGMNEEERRKLFYSLIDLYRLDMEEERVLEMAEKFREKEE